MSDNILYDIDNIILGVSTTGDLKEFFITKDSTPIWKSETFEEVNSDDYDKVASKYKEILKKESRNKKIKSGALSSKEVDSGWPGQDRAVDIGSKPRFYMHPAGTWPGRATGPLSQLPEGILRKIQTDYDTKFANGIKSMIQTLMRGFSKDKALDYAISSNADLETSDKKKLIEIYNKYIGSKNIV